MAGGGRVFHIGACIGEGGFGEVYRAVMRSPAGLEREVAVKTLKPAVAPDVEAVRRLRDEARLLARLDHRAILAVHDLVRLDGRIALVTQLLHGEDLNGLLRGAAELPERALAEAMSEVASALAAASQRLELVHRDVKPSNIYIGKDGTARLLDFGIARSPQVSREGHTASGLVVGTFGYLAPERVTDEHHGPASDIYSLGCVLYAALTRTPLYQDVARAESLRLAIDDELHDEFLARRLAPVLESPLGALLAQMLSYERTERPTARALEVMFEDIAAGRTGPTLRQWARARQWPPFPNLNGALVGRELSEEPIAFAEVPPRGAVHPAMSQQAMTVDFGAELPLPAPVPTPTPAPAPLAVPTPAAERAVPPPAQAPSAPTSTPSRSTRRAHRSAPAPRRSEGLGCLGWSAVLLLAGTLFGTTAVFLAEEGHMPGLKRWMDERMDDVHDWQDRRR